MVKRLFLCLIFAGASLLGMLSTAVAAETTNNVDKQELHWRCWYDQRASIHCLLDAELAEKAQPASQNYQAPANLPKIVRDLRTRPASFRAKLVRIPMYSDPIDEGFAGQLAQACMCGARNGCSVQYTNQVPHHEEVAQIMLRQMDWKSRPESRLAASGEGAVRSIRLAGNL